MVRSVVAVSTIGLGLLVTAAGACSDSVSTNGPGSLGAGGAEATGLGTSTSVTPGGTGTTTTVGTSAGTGATTGTSAGTGATTGATTHTSASTSTSTGSPASTCTDTLPPGQTPTCADWKTWNTCGADWFKTYCDATCGRCTGSTTPPASTGSTTGSTTGSSTGTTTSGGTTVPPITGGCQGWASRYWDCCKPSCAWKANVPSGMSAAASCSSQNQSLGATDQGSACSGGGGAFMCWNEAPWAVSSTLAYGFAAVPSSSGTQQTCGRCYQVQFSGTSHNAGSDPGSAALAGKTMIVQATNTGGDVASGQFDLLIPGGGVGAFNACSSQCGTSNLGDQYGGFLPACKSAGGGLAGVKACIAAKCDSVFTASNMSQLKAACHWFADWFEAADNPNMTYKEVACPSALTGLTGMSRSDVGSSCQ